MTFTGLLEDTQDVYEWLKGQDFVDTDSKSQSEDFMKIVMRMRDAGATVIIMHHATKTGKKRHLHMECRGSLPV